MAVEIISKLKQKNGAKFFLVDADDVEINGISLTEYLAQMKKDIQATMVLDPDPKESFENALGSSVPDIDPASPDSVISPDPKETFEKALGSSVSVADPDSTDSAISPDPTETFEQAVLGD